VLTSRATISAPPPDASLVPGAKNAIEACLGVKAGEKVAIITHRGEVSAIASALLEACREVGASVEAFVLSPSEASEPRVVGALLSQLAQVDVSILVSSMDGLPVSLRRRVVEVEGTPRRHGHMIGITPAMMTQSMRADYAEVARVSSWLAGKLRPGAVVRANAANGTDLELRTDPVAKVGVASGVLTGPGWTNLPGGEVFAVPANVEGTLVPDGGIWMPEGTDLPLAFRTKITFEKGEIVRLDGASEPCARLEAALQASNGGRRVGQVGFGTNTGVLAPIGALLQDLKVPGFHLSLGHTCPEVTGATWDSDVEIPLLTRRANVTIDGEPVLSAGKFPPAALGK
jgi:leucyl aminopeptidase (aminopeptidase T)